MLQFNIQQLVERIVKSKSYDIHAFKGCILTLYVNHSKGEALESENDMIIELTNMIKEADQTSFDRIRKMQIGYLISNLQNAIDIVNIPD